MSSEAYRSSGQCAQNKTDSPVTSSNAGHPASPQNLRHNVPVAKIAAPMRTAESGGSFPGSPFHHSAKGTKSASPMPAVDTGASHGGRLLHSATWMKPEVTNSDLDSKLPSGRLQVISTSSSRSESTGDTEVFRRRAPSGVTVLDEKVIERLQSLAEEGADSGSPKSDLSRCDFRWKAVAVCSVIVVLLFTTVAVLLVQRWSLGQRKLERSRSCGTSGCQQVAEEILSRLDLSVDPCNDIQAHVCGPIRWESELVFDTATDMMHHWRKRGAAYLESKRRPQAAFGLYDACMEARSETVSELKDFMRKRHLSWPEYESRNKHALSVLLDLLINWGVPFWFEMSLRCLPNETRHSLQINRVKMNKWRRQQQITADQNRLPQYAMQFYDIFGATQDARARIPRLLALEKEIHAIVEPPEKEEKVEGPTVFRMSLSIVSIFTPNITADMWLSYLNEHLHPYRFQGNDSILIDDFSLPKMMKELFGRFSNEDMLYTLGWWFAQRFTVITSLDGGVVAYGSVALAKANRPTDCYALAETRFLRQLFLERAWTSLGEEGMHDVEELLETIRNTTITMLRSLPWMDEKARKEAAAIVAVTTFEAWRSDLADVAYGQVNDSNLCIKGDTSVELSVDSSQTDFPPPSYSSVIERWINSAITYKSRVQTWPLNDSFQHRHLWYAQLGNYDYWWNSLFLQMAAFTEPLFFLDAPSLSANYAGLGFLVASHLAKAFDLKRGIRLDVDRKTRTWISSASQSEYEEKMACAGGSERLLNHIVALEIALAAAFDPEIGRRGDSEEEDLQYSLPGHSETYTSEMVFYLTYCRATCGSTPGCRDVLRRVDHFGKVFRCPENAPMAAAPKCSFFRK